VAKKEEAKPKAEISMTAWLKELVHLAQKGDFSGILVVGTMFGMLLWSMYVGFERLMLFRRARGQSRDLAGELGKSLTAGDYAAALKSAKSETYKDSYLGKVVDAALTEYEQGHDGHALEAARREIERATAMEQGRLREGLGVLATTGSTTPFVGLVGTVLGIIRCFGAMNSEGGADLASLSGGIAEALYSTALGIVVAIVGIWIYNYFNSILEDITKDLTTATQQLVNVLEKDVRRRGDAAASK
jgi:biopolymer transport protein ExbB/TolQ